ncbi:MAG: hypothetical protein WBN03_18410 [Desulfobacterales bacterium]
MPEMHVNHSETKPPGRSVLKWLMLTTVGLAGACLIALILVGGYFYRHPSRVKELAAEQISNLSGVAVTVGELSYSLNPLHLQARDLNARPTDGRNGFDLQLGLITVDARITGPFGRRKLVVEHLRIKDFSALVKTDARLPAALSEAATPSLVGRLVRKVVGYFLISDIAWSSLEADNGRLTIIDDAMQLVLDGLRLESDAANRINARGRMLESRIGADTRVAIADYRIHLEPTARAETGSIAGEVVFSGGRISASPFSADDITATVRLTYQPDRNEITLPELNLTGHLKTPMIAAASPYPTKRLAFEGRGVYRAAEKVLDLAGWSLEAAGLLKASGTARLEVGTPYRLQLSLTEGRLDADQFGSLYTGLAGGRPVPLAVSGAIGLKGSVDGPLTGKGSEWQGNLQFMFQRIPVAYHDADNRLQALLSGSVQANGYLADPQVQLRLEATDMAITTKYGVLTEFRPLVSASGHFPVLDVSLHTRSPGARLTAGSQRLTQVRVELDRGRFNLQNGEMSLPRIILSSSTLANLAGSLTRTGERTLLRLQGRNNALLQAAASWGFLPADWRFNAQDTLDLDLKWQTGGGGSLDCRMALQDFQFSNPGESRFAEKLDVAVETNTRFGREAGAVQSDVRLTATAGEILWGKYYLDLGTMPFSASGRLKIKTDQGLLIVDRLETSLKNLIVLTVSGSARSTTEDLMIDLRLNVPAVKAESLYRHLVAEPHKYDQPNLSDVRIDGRIRGEIALYGGLRSMHAKGRVYWQQGHVSSKNGTISLSDVDLDLPFWYQSAQEAAPSSTLTGHLTVKKMQLPYLAEQPLTLNFDIGPNRLVLRQPPALRLFSGRIDLGPVALTNLFNEHAKLETHLSATGIEIDNLLKGIWSQPTGGILAGRLESVRLENNRLSSRGTVTIDIFDGRIDIIDPGISGPLTSIPVFFFNSRINDLGLEKMTAGTAFGKIRGILRGSATEVEIVSGQPQKFELRLETVSKKGVQQKINVRAVESIASLGGGGSPFVGLAGSFARFFREFPYWKIGIAASLENDVFKVNGTIMEDSKEYLVKKSGFSGVDVVNLNPNNRISFKDMVKRIKRISGTGGGPVIR